MENAFYYGLSVGCITFLIQKTDFVIEYARLFLDFCHLTKLKKILLIPHYENLENPADYASFVEFFCAMNGTQKNIFGFLCRLISCFICLNCFLTVVVGAALLSYYTLFFSFLIAMSTYLALCKIKNNVYSD
jgi:hypothetical protein